MLSNIYSRSYCRKIIYSVIFLTYYFIQVIQFLTLLAKPILFLHKTYRRYTFCYINNISTILACQQNNFGHPFLSQKSTQQQSDEYFTAITVRQKKKFWQQQQIKICNCNTDYKICYICICQKRYICIRTHTGFINQQHLGQQRYVQVS